METKKKIGKFTLVLLAILLLFAGAIRLGLQAKLDTAGWASWVQAVGSIGALGVAIFVMSRQNAHAAKLMRDADLRDLKRKGQSVAVLMERALCHLEYAARALPVLVRSGNEQGTQTGFKLMDVRIQEVRKVLLAIPAHELGSYDMTSALQDMIDRLTDARHYLEFDSFAALYATADMFETAFSNNLANARASAQSFREGLQLL